MTRYKHCLSATLLALAAAGACAGQQTFSSTHEGDFWTPLGYASQDDGGLLSGRVGRVETPTIKGLGDTFSDRAYIVFDLSGQTQAIISATLRIKVESYSSIGPGTFSSSGWTTLHNLTESFGVFDVSTPLADLTAAYGNPGGPLGTPNPAGLAIADDLGSGQQFGSFVASADVVGSYVDVTLSASGVAALNAARGSSFAVGLRFTGEGFSSRGGIFGAPLVDQSIDIASQDTAHQLVITSVPEPSAAWLTLPGALLVLARRRKA